MVSADAERCFLGLLFNSGIADGIEHIADDSRQYLAIGYIETSRGYGWCSQAQAAGDEG